MTTDLAVLAFTALLCAVLYLPQWVGSRNKSRHPKITYLNEYREQRRGTSEPSPQAAKENRMGRSFKNDSRLSR